jgi:hypothetical protein
MGPTSCPKTARADRRAIFGLLAALGCGQPDAIAAAHEREARDDARDPIANVPTSEEPTSDSPARSRREAPASWAFYPVIDPALSRAYDEDANARVVLERLADTLAPYRWASVDDWDNTGYVRIEPDDPRGFVSKASGTLHVQTDGTAQLGCAGGFLEGVRATLAPTLTMDALRVCDQGTLTMLGEIAPAQCDPWDFGAHAIANVARAVQDEAEIGVPFRIVPVPDDLDALAPLATRGPMHLCTVSHRSRTAGEIRRAHHLMIAIADPARRQGVWLFDTTGYRGAVVRLVSLREILRYVRFALASNETYNYDPASAQVDCIPITRRR